MRTAIMLSMIFALLGLTAPGAFAQSEDEKILDQGVAEPAPKQSRADDELDDEELDEQVFYSGVGVERVSTDFDNLGEATNLEGVMGFRIPTFPWIGLEIDIGQTLIPGTYRDPRPAQAAQPCVGPNIPPGCPIPAQPAEKGASDGSRDEFAMQALGLSLALKSRGRFYVTGKYGYRYITTSNDTINENRSGNGFGLGVGYRWGKGLSGVELGYKQLAEDVESIGLTFFVRTTRR
ncbi:MAG: hypothetical protein ACRETF_01115 [Nevskiaceae bacterium]